MGLAGRSDAGDNGSYSSQDKHQSETGQGKYPPPVGRVRFALLDPDADCGRGFSAIHCDVGQRQVAISIKVLATGRGSKFSSSNAVIKNMPHPPQLIMWLNKTNEFQMAPGMDLQGIQMTLENHHPPYHNCKQDIEILHVIDFTDEQL